jgi:hypothetical protein
MVFYFEDGVGWILSNARAIYIGTFKLKLVKEYINAEN